MGIPAGLERLAPVDLHEPDTGLDPWKPQQDRAPESVPAVAVGDSGRLAAQGPCDEGAELEALCKVQRRHGFGPAARSLRDDPRVEFRTEGPGVLPGPDRSWRPEQMGNRDER